MSIRSDVLIAMQFDDLNHLKTYLAKCKLLGDAYLNEAIGMYSYCQRRGDLTGLSCQVMFMFLERVKWYEDSPHTNAHHQLRRLAWEANAYSMLIRFSDDYDDYDDTEWDISVPMYKAGNECVLGLLFSIERNIRIEVDPDETVELDELEKHYESE